MNSYERFICALERREPDRVPLYEGYIDTHVIEALCPGGTYHDLIEVLDLDMVRVTEGDVRHFLDAEQRTYQDKWGVTYRLETEVSGFPIRGPIQEEKDLASYNPPDPDDPLVYCDLPEAIDRFKGRRAVIWRGLDGFHMACLLRGMENLLMDCVLNPGFVHDLMRLCNDFQTRVAVGAIERGADLVVLLDDYADKNSPLMGPERFEMFILPYLKNTVQAVKDAGGYVIKHTDGNIWSILEPIIDTGIDAINPLEPTAGMDIGKVKRRYGDRVCVIGNIDCGELLCRGTEEAVREAVRECIRAAAPGGGHIMSSSNSLQSGVNPDNYAALVDETKRYGRYPIQL
jgi:uroporphyrinogen decarboxylase